MIFSINSFVLIPNVQSSGKSLYQYVQYANCFLESRIQIRCANMIKLLRKHTRWSLVKHRTLKSRNLLLICCIVENRTGALQEKVENGEQKNGLRKCKLHTNAHHNNI